MRLIISIIGLFFKFDSGSLPKFSLVMLINSQLNKMLDDRKIGLMEVVWVVFILLGFWRKLKFFKRVLWFEYGWELIVESLELIGDSVALGVEEGVSGEELGVERDYVMIDWIFVHIKLIKALSANVWVKRLKRSWVREFEALFIPIIGLYWC